MFHENGNTVVRADTTGSIGGVHGYELEITLVGNLNLTAADFYL